jgi:L-threonylcarbamoyladenylate synthase
MPVVVVDPHHPDPGVLAEAAARLCAGGLVAFPTETVYGLGANALDPEAVAAIYVAKGRPAWNPVIAHVASIAGARALAADWPETAERLARRFWPGPLTLVVPRHPDVPPILSAGGPAIGVRWPDHAVATALITAAGVPIAAPSANRFTELSPTTATHVRQSLGDRVGLVLDGGPCTIGIESTVVDLTSPVPRVLRPGAISASAIGAELGMAVVSGGRESVALDGESPAEIPLAPGQAERHYAPRTPVWLFDPTDADAAISAAHQEAGARPIALLLLGAMGGVPDDAVIVRAPTDPLGYARALYATLHTLDQAGCALILIERPPESPGWEAVLDRLTRAAA